MAFSIVSKFASRDACLFKETKSSDEGIAGPVDCICMKPARNSLAVNAENIVSTLSMTYPHKAPIQAHERES